MIYGTHQVSQENKGGRGARSFGKVGIRVIHKVTLSSPLMLPPIPSFSGIRKVKTID